MTDVSSNNKRLAKNTLMLYVRMLLVMFVSLFTVRLVLHILGEQDYGIYNVVGGIVVMFSFLSKTLAAASNRYFAFYIGKNDNELLGQVFSVTFRLYLIVIFIIILLVETLGLWFLYNKMTIPPERLIAAEWVFHFSVISFSLTLFATPFQAMIIAHEEMNVYAFVGVLEVLLQLFMVILISRSDSYDILVLYALIMLLNRVVVEGVYFLYSYVKYPVCHIIAYWNSSLAKEIASFSAWNLFGAISNIIRSQGINILINTFFNPAINAARGLAYQVNQALNVFSSNFYTAVRPQITKYYAQNNQKETLHLVFRSSKMTFYLLFFLAAPLLIFIEPVLSFWLENVPDYTSTFTKLVICVAILDALSHPLMALAQATGQVKLYQFIVGSLTILNLPISWFFLYLGYSATSTMVVALALSLIALFARLLVLYHIINFPLKSYFHSVIMSISKTSVVILVVIYLIKRFIYDFEPNYIFLFISLCISVFLSILLIYTLGSTNDEKLAIKSFVSSRIRRYKNQ